MSKRIENVSTPVEVGSADIPSLPPSHPSDPSLPPADGDNVQTGTDEAMTLSRGAMDRTTILLDWSKTMAGHILVLADVLGGLGGHVHNDSGPGASCSTCIQMRNIKSGAAALLTKMEGV